jgi:hypothetical protein
LKNLPFCPISALGSNFNPRNTQCIPVVKITAFLEPEPRLNEKADLTGQAKMNIFQRSQFFIIPWLINIVKEK